MYNVYMYGCVCIMLFFDLVPVPGGTLVSEELSCIVDHSCLVLLLSAHRAAPPPRKPLKSLHTCSVEHVRTRQQHLKRNSDISYQSTDWLGTGIGRSVSDMSDSSGHIYAFIVPNGPELQERI